MEESVPKAPAAVQPSAVVGSSKPGNTSPEEKRARILARRRKNTTKTPEEIAKAKQRAEKRALRRAQRTMPDDIQNNVELNSTIAKQIPNNYSFEIKKTLWRIRKENAKTVANIKQHSPVPLSTAITSLNLLAYKVLPSTHVKYRSMEDTQSDHFWLDTPAANALFQLAKATFQ